MPIICVYSDQQPGFRVDPAQHKAEGAHGGCGVRTHHRCGHQGHQGGSPQAISSLSTLLARLLTPLARLLTPLARLLTLMPSFDPSCQSFVLTFFAYRSSSVSSFGADFWLKVET